MQPMPRFSGAAILLLAMNVLVLEVALTRVFSVMTYHHFTYLIIGLALLGFGAAGTVLTVNRRFAGNTINPVLLADCAWLFGLLVLLCFLLITRTGVDAMALYRSRDYSQIFRILLLLVLASVPFLFAGLGIGYLITKSGDQINRLYFFDLVGAGLGSLGSLFAINYLGIPTTVFSVALSGCVVAMLVGGRTGGRIRWRYPLTAAVAAGLALGSVFDDGLIRVPFPHSKPAAHYDTEHRWHVVARIDVTEPLAGYPQFGGQLSRIYQAPEPPLVFRQVFQDGIAPTGIIKLQDRDPKDMRILNHYLQGCPYVIRPGGNVLVIGPGGGVDVAIALAHGSSHVTAVDINPWMIDFVQNRYNDFAGGLYRRPDVEVICAEGRHFLTATDQKFDVIQLSGVDTFSALASGAYALSENYLYTREAISDFLGHLSEDGVLSFSRWLFTPPRETLRLVVTARIALERLGTRNPGRNILVIAGHRGYDPPWAETLIKRQPFTPAEVDSLQRWADRLHFEMIYNPLLPYVAGGQYDALEKTPEFDPIMCAQQFDSALRADDDGLREYIQGYFYNITPSVDDAPFFFNFYRLGNLFKSQPTAGGYPITRLPLGLFVLLACLVQIVILGGLFILLPMRSKAAGLRGKKGTVHGFVYFACIGLAFIGIEIMLLQKLAVFLGGPVYSMAVTLFSLLVFCGTGSLLAGRLTRNRLRLGGAGALLVLVVTVIATMWFLNHVVPNLMELSHLTRCVLAVFALMPVGLAMGMPFPTGIRMVERIDTELIPWAWCVNACATVLGSIASILIAMFVGLTDVAYGAALVYLIAMLALILAPLRPASTSAGGDRG
ncbi:MAG: hypothetical protein V3V49_02095 [Candidatus Krumholzibacteria bacterium]